AEVRHVSLIVAKAIVQEAAAGLLFSTFGRRLTNRAQSRHRSSEAAHFPVRGTNQAEMRSARSIGSGLGVPEKAVGRRRRDGRGELRLPHESELSEDLRAGSDCGRLS